MVIQNNIDVSKFCWNIFVVNWLKKIKRDKRERVDEVIKYCATNKLIAFCSAFIAFVYVFFFFLALMNWRWWIWEHCFGIIAIISCLIIQATSHRIRCDRHFWFVIIAVWFEFGCWICIEWISVRCRFVGVIIGKTWPSTWCGCWETRLTYSARTFVCARIICAIATKSCWVCGRSTGICIAWEARCTIIGGGMVCEAICIVIVWKARWIVGATCITVTFESIISAITKVIWAIAAAIVAERAAIIAIVSIEWTAVWAIIAIVTRTIMTARLWFW